MDSFSKWKTWPQQAEGGNAPNEMISGSNDRSAEEIHVTAKPLQLSVTRSQTLGGMSQATDRQAAWTSKRRTKGADELDSNSRKSLVWIIKNWP